VCCKRFDEDGAHLFFKCKEIVQEWKRLKLESIRDCMSQCQSAHAMIDVLISLRQEEQTKVCCLLWRWWTRRNKINVKETAISMDTLHAEIVYWSGESTQFCSRQQIEKKQKVQQASIAPPGDWLKINCDGSFLPGSETGGWGFVVRDAQGCVRGASAGRLNAVAGPAHAEAEACYKAV
jgi:hypothetical protein